MSATNCLFCKIIKKEIPAKVIFENDQVLGFVDIYPQAKKHYLFIHKNHTSNVNELAENTGALGEIFMAMKKFSQDENLEGEGFRIVTNVGPNAGQTVFHTHFHLLAGERLGHFGS